MMFILAALPGVISLSRPYCIDAFISSSPILRTTFHNQQRQNISSPLFKSKLNNDSQEEQIGYESTGDDDNDDGTEQQEFDIDEITSMTELRELSRSIDGPEINFKYSSLESAKDQIWAFVEDTAEDDIDKMCMGQLAGLMMEMGGGDFAEGATIEYCRDQVFDLAYELSCPEGESN